MTGMIRVMSVPAWMSPGSRKWMPLNRESPRARVWMSGSPDRYRTGPKKSFHV